MKDDILKIFDSIKSWDCKGDELCVAVDEVFGAGSWDKIIEYIKNNG